MPREKSAGIVLSSGPARRPLFLVLHYGAGHWSLPKGHLEKGESEKQAALRELREETGIRESEVDLIDGFREEIRYFFKRAGATVHKTVVFLLARVRGRPSVRLSFEHTGFEWLPLEKAVAKLTYASDAGVIKKAGAFLKKAP